MLGRRVFEQKKPSAKFSENPLKTGIIFLKIIIYPEFKIKIPIDVILIETLGVQPERDELCRQLLIQNGYIFDNKIAHNEIFVRKL